VGKNVWTDLSRCRFMSVPLGTHHLMLFAVLSGMCPLSAGGVLQGPVSDAAREQQDEAVPRWSV
jgi:hypothetical protein